MKREAFLCVAVVGLLKQQQLVSKRCDNSCWP